MYAILLSGGVGTRAGFNIPKQYIDVKGRPVISYCIETCSLSKCISKLVIVASEEWHKQIQKWLKEWDINNKFLCFSPPGATRQLSIMNALEDIEKKDNECQSYVMIHDAARPLLSLTDIDFYSECVKGHDGLMPILQMKDTVYLSEDGKKITGLIDRKKVVAGQAPEIFVFDKYFEANKSLGKDIININGSSEPAVMAGMDIVTVEGNEMNFKITTKEDVFRFEKLI